MTIIAFDGTTMAADRAAWSGSYSYKVRKVYRLRQHKVPFARGELLVGLVGQAAFALQVLRWMEDGGERPVALAEDQQYAVALVVARGRAWKLHAHGLTPEPLTGGTAALGAPIGCAAAMAAMRMGASARRAILIASEFTDVAGGGVDVERL